LATLPLRLGHPANDALFAHSGTAVALENCSYARLKIGVFVEKLIQLYKLQIVHSIFNMGQIKNAILSVLLRGY
jgi:hypothetical protein